MWRTPARAIKRRARRARYTHPAMSDLTTHTLDCGASLVIERIAGVRSASITWLVPAGYAMDPEAKLGMSAMFAELLLRGAGSLDSRAQVEAFDAIGASRATEVGALTFRLGSTMLGDRFAPAASLLAEMALRPRMDYDAIDPSRDLALQAIAALKDEPQERAGLLLRASHLPSPLNRSGLGTREGLEALEREDLVGGWFARARPVRSIISVAGAVDPAQVRETFSRLLATWTGEYPEPAIGPAPAGGYHHETEQTSQVQVLLAHEAPPEAHPDSVLERFVVAVLSGGMSGRLFSEVREKRGLCYSVSASYRGDRDYGVVSSYVGTTPERAQESLDVLHAELRRIMSGPGAVTPDEFDRAKVGLKSSVVFGGESTAARAGALASDMRRLGRPRSLREVSDTIDRVTLDQVNAYLARRSMGRTTIATLGPAPLQPPAP